MPGTVWKGAIAFSLVDLPAALYPAGDVNERDFHPLDRRDFAPFGYQRIDRPGRSRHPFCSPSEKVCRGSSAVNAELLPFFEGVKR